MIATLLRLCGHLEGGRESPTARNPAEMPCSARDRARTPLLSRPRPRPSPRRKRRGRARRARGPASSPGSCAASHSLPSSIAAPVGSHAMILVSGLAHRITCPAPRHRAASPPAGHPVVEPSGREILEDLAAGRLSVEGRVRLCRPVARGTSRAPRRVERARRTAPEARSAAGVSSTLAPYARMIRRRSTENDLGHDGDESIPARRARHGERDPRVTRGRFDHGLAWREQATPLGVEHDTEREPVFHGPARVRRPQRHISTCAGRRLMRTTGVRPMSSETSP